MAQIVYLNDEPSQQFGLTISEVDYTFLFQYAPNADRWSYSMWVTGENSPLVAGRYIRPAMDLLDLTQIEGWHLVVLDRSGKQVSSHNWYERMTIIAQDGFPDTFMMLTSTEDALLAIAGN